MQSVCVLDGSENGNPFGRGGKRNGSMGVLHGGGCVCTAVSPRITIAISPNHSSVVADDRHVAAGGKTD